MKIDKFVLAIIGVISLSYFFPFWGTSQSPIPLEVISSFGISLIFFFYGLKLKPDKLKTGLKNWKLHLLVQASTFLVFPLLVLLCHPFLKTQQQEVMWLAFFFLATLPSTVSSSVVMVSIAKGNVTAAIFNASISGIIGIAITPLWLGLFVDSSQINFDFTEIYIKLILQIILPVVIGFLLQRLLNWFTNKYSSALTLFDKLVILIIIYKSFAQSFYENIFSEVSVLDVLFIFIGVLILFFMVFFITKFIAVKLNFNKEDQITARFCGTKKSLVHGTVFSKILFGNTAAIGVVLLPLMLFHAAQIVIISFIAAKLGRR